MSRSESKNFAFDVCRYAKKMFEVTIYNEQEPTDKDKKWDSYVFKHSVFRILFCVSHEYQRGKNIIRVSVPGSFYSKEYDYIILPTFLRYKPLSEWCEEDYKTACEILENTINILKFMYDRQQESCRKCRYSKKQNNSESNTISQDEIEIIEGREQFRQSHKKKMSQIGVRYDKQGFII